MHSVVWQGGKLKLWDQVFCETSQGNSQSQMVSGVLSSQMPHAVYGEPEVIRDIKKLFDFFNENLVVK